MENDILHSLKIEISKNFQLTPYEKLSFHKILGIVKSENGTNILLRDLQRQPLIRQSAITELKFFDNPIVTEALVGLLKEDIGFIEIRGIFEHLNLFGKPEHIEVLMEFIENNRLDERYSSIVLDCYNLLSKLGSGSARIFEYARDIALNEDNSIEERCAAVRLASVMPELSFFEEILLLAVDQLSCSAFQSLSFIASSLTQSGEMSEEEEIFTYSPDKEDKLVLYIRVLLGKMTNNYDNYSSSTRISFIEAMIDCNHREQLIYIMKALTSGNAELIDMTLYLLFDKVHSLRDTDKLLRNLLSLPSTTKRDNQIIIDIFERYFSELADTRKNNIFRDKMYNYLLVSLDTYFETYRRDFMITEVAEKDYPEHIQKIRSFILENFSPMLKKKLVEYLRNSDRRYAQKIIGEIAEFVPYLNVVEDELHYFLEMLYDNDEKARDISASRIENINFEKRYVRNRIIRVCEIIRRLKISEASTNLVKILNYVKKYPDPKIYEAVSHTLSSLNYSYMLGELEVMLFSGDAAEQKMALRFLSLYSDQRSLNILLDALNDKLSDDSEFVLEIMNILVKRDLHNNVNANQIFKKLAEVNPNSMVKKMAILALGRCGLESDLDYLNSLFYELKENDSRESVVQAIAAINELNPEMNKRQLIRYLKEYLKEPSIKVRIYSCALLIFNGYRDALQSIQDMMVIKNKGIQREILSIIGNFMTAELAYFLISLLKEEYAITGDIIELLKKLPDVELKEIDHFIINIFRKFEGGALDKEMLPRPDDKKDGVINVSSSYKTLLCISDRHIMENQQSNSLELALYYLRVYQKVTSEITQRNGVITRSGFGKLVAMFDNPEVAAECSLALTTLYTEANLTQLPEIEYRVAIYLFTDEYNIINDEIVFYPDNIIEKMIQSKLDKLIIMDRATSDSCRDKFYRVPLPEIIFRFSECAFGYHELLYPYNFTSICDSYISDLREMEEARVKKDQELEEELKQRNKKNITPAAMAYAKMVDDIGKMLQLELMEVTRYINKRSTDRELNRTVEKMLGDIQKRYIIETSKLIIK